MRTRYFFSNRQHSFQKVGDTLPHHIGANRAGFGKWRVLRRLVVHECAVFTPAPAGGGLSTNHAQNRHVVLQEWNTGLCAIANHLADIVDFVIALGTFAQYDIGILSLGNVSGAERERHCRQSDAERFNALAQTFQTFYRPLFIKAPGRKITTDMSYAKRREHTKSRIIGDVLCSELHPARSGSSRSIRAHVQRRRQGQPRSFVK